MEENISGGYSCVTTAQVGNLLTAREGRGLPTSALRCYLALLVVTATREASKRAAKAEGLKPKEEKRYSVEELLSLMPDLTERTVRSGLRTLKNQGLASISKKEITLNSFPTEEAKAWMEAAQVKQRVIPAPRRMLRFLAKSSKRSLILTSLAYMTRGLYKYKRIIKNAGTAKVSWIAESFKLSATSVKSARRELITLGFISKDKNSHQLKLNRTGAYFQVNLAWACPQAQTESREGKKEAELQFAPLTAKNCTQSAPPYRKQVTPYGSTKTKKPSSGFCKAKVTFRSIQQEDIQKISLLLMLYRSAVEQKVFHHNERNLLSFFATAVKAKRSWTNPIRMFAWTVRNDFKYINDSDEKQAEKTLKSYRKRNPEAFNFLEPEPQESQIQHKAEFQELLKNLVENSSIVA